MDTDNTRDHLQALRRMGLSQSEIARRTGIPQPKLSRWESGDVPDSADQALKLRELRVKLSRRRQK